MLSSIRRVMRGLKQNTSGNAVLLVAAGLPALIGASGLAVDSAQYYMWKRELQFAVDQAALAGAWAKTNTATTSTYASRALQEYNTNMQVAGSFDATPTISTVNYNGGTNNAVKVIASATKTLPFTNIVTGRGVTVVVEARASFDAGVVGTTTSTVIQGVTACMVALHPTANGALLIGGTASGTVSCGGATLSSDANGAIRENGNPNAQFSGLAARGGIEASLLDNVGGVASRLRPNQAGLINPFANVATPTGSSTPRTYSCPTATSGTPAVYTYTATQKVRTVVTYAYTKGANAGSAVSYTYTSGTGYLPNTDDNPGINTSLSRTTSAYTATGPTQSGPTVGTAVNITGSGSNKVWRTPTTTTYTTILNVGSTLTTPAVAGNDGIARPLPGTYSTINIACETQFSPGIYVITGSMDFSTNKVVSGSDLMFVFTRASDIANINSNTTITLSGITKTTLMGTYSYSNADATKLAGMLFWDPLGTTEIKWNGNSASILNGALYMPNRSLWFNGTASVTGRCMMLIGSTLTFTGTINLSSFCLPGGATIPTLRDTETITTTTAGVAASVKLVV